MPPPPPTTPWHTFAQDMLSALLSASPNVNLNSKGTQNQSKVLETKGTWVKKPFATSIMLGDQATPPVILGAKDKVHCH